MGTNHPHIDKYLNNKKKLKLPKLFSCVRKVGWNPDKNEKLKTERGISFEEIVFHIEHGDEVDILDHPNQVKYPGQKISVVIIEGYAYFVPYVETDEEIFLKTIIPSRKATKKYVGSRK